MKNVRERLLSLLAGVLLSVFIASAAVTFTLNLKPLYYMDISLLDISETSGIDEAVIKKNYDILIEYNNIGGQEKLVFPDFAMSEGGEIHFEEVRRIFQGIEYACMIAFAGTAAAIVVMHKRKSYLYLKITAFITVVLPIIAAALISINWMKFFVTFHEIVFNNDYWLFDPSEDPIITVLPDAFFMHCAIMITAIVMLSGIGCWCIYRRKTHLKNEG